MFNPDENHRIVIESSRNECSVSSSLGQLLDTASVHPLFHLFHPRVIITPPSPTEQKLSSRNEASRPSITSSNFRLFVRVIRYSSIDTLLFCVFHARKSHRDPNSNDICIYESIGYDVSSARVRFDSNRAERYNDLVETQPMDVPRLLRIARKTIGFFPEQYTRRRNTFRHRPILHIQCYLEIRV